MNEKLSLYVIYNQGDGGERIYPRNDSQWNSTHSFCDTALYDNEQDAIDDAEFLNAGGQFYEDSGCWKVGQIEVEFKF